MKNNDSFDLTIPCHECQAGQMHREYVTYFTWLADELVTVPDFPAWVCDVCHRREYDMHALNELSLLLSPNAGKSNPKPRPVPRPPERKNTRPSRPE
jgi:YgiT-type zinc finger domain-containing protein